MNVFEKEDAVRGTLFFLIKGGLLYLGPKKMLATRPGKEIKKKLAKIITFNPRGLRNISLKFSVRVWKAGKSSYFCPPETKIEGAESNRDLARKRLPFSGNIRGG